MQHQQTDQSSNRRSSNLWRALSLALAASFITSVAHAAKFDVIADTPVSFRANFIGIDTDPTTVGGGNDFQIVVFNFWTVLVNLRGDAVDSDGNASGFYEIQLTHSGNLLPDPHAPITHTFLFWGSLAPGVVLADEQVDAEVNGAGTDYLSTTVDISYDPIADVVNYSGSIAGDSDLDGDGVLDSKQTDNVVQILQGLKDKGVITGKDMGQILKQTNKFTK